MSKCSKNVCCIGTDAQSCGRTGEPKSRFGLYVILGYLGLIGLCLLGVYVGLKG